MDDVFPSFCIGQHESNRPWPVSPDAVRKTHESKVRLCLS